MIRPFMNRFGKTNQRGGIAILTALGFLLFSIPLITSSLNLAQNTAIDSRVKTEIVHEQYCGLAVREYFDYLVTDSTRWANWLTANVDLVLDPLGHTSTETIEPCGESITITVVQQPLLPPDSLDPLGNPLVSIPAIAPFEKWIFQTLLTVDNANPNGGDAVVYTATVINRSEDEQVLNNIIVNIPTEFDYDCNAAPNQFTHPDLTTEDIDPDPITNPSACDGTDTEYTWKLIDLVAGKPTLQPGDVVTLTFTVTTTTSFGTYCGDGRVKPAENQSRTGQMANVQIGQDAGICIGETIAVTLVADSIDLVSTNTGVSPFVYTFDIDFTMTIINTGVDEIQLHDIRNLLPPGFSTLVIDPSGDLTDGLKSGTPDWKSSVGRWDYEWDWNPWLPFAGLTSTTIKYSTVASISRGVYWSDLIVDVHQTEIKDNYTWPTAFLWVNDVFDVVITDEEGNELPVSFQVWIGDQDGLIKSWPNP